LTEVSGLRVGHATLRGAGALTGTTVVLAPPEGAVAGVDVRGAAPGSRETDLLDPHRLVQRVHALVLSGGSAYGLATADGVMRGLEADGVGFDVGAGVVPIVPAAVVFDLARGGDFAARPTADTGLAAYRAAAATRPGDPVECGCVGAGTGALAGGLKGGIGTAAVRLGPGGSAGTVAALVVLNAAGTAVDPGDGRPYGARYGLDGEFDRLRVPDPAELRAARENGRLRTAIAGPMRATTLAVIGTDLTLDKAQATLLATMGADGLARAVRPVHTMYDGDLTFALATAHRPPPTPDDLHALLAAAADCVSRSIVHALLAADPVPGHPTYRETFRSAFTPRE
jgi:putative pantetheine hydrolase